MTWIANSFFCPLQDPNIAPVFVPIVRHVFPTKDDACMFYRDYARLAGFSLRTARTSKETNHWCVPRRGGMKGKKGEEPHKTEKGSKRCGCPAYVKVKHGKKRGL